MHSLSCKKRLKDKLLIDGQYRELFFHDASSFFSFLINELCHQKKRPLYMLISLHTPLRIDKVFTTNLVDGFPQKLL